MTPDERLALLPRIRRARGYLLYADDGSRYLDLWQVGGRAILGHRGGGVVTAVKRSLDRGLLAPLPSGGVHRLARALQRLTGQGYGVVVLRTFERALDLALRLARSAVAGEQADCVPERPLDPVFEALVPESDEATPRASEAVRVALWRPFLSALHEHDARRTLLLPVLPDGGLVEAQPLLVPEALIDARIRDDLVSESALTLLETAAAALVTPSVRPVLPLACFQAVGPYLVPRTVGASVVPDEAVYDELFRRFLDAGVVISPDPTVPSIVPAEVSEGERTFLLRIARG